MLSIFMHYQETTGCPPKNSLLYRPTCYTDVGCATNRAWQTYQNETGSIISFSFLEQFWRSMTISISPTESLLSGLIQNDLERPTALFVCSIFDEHSYIDWHIFWQFCQWDMIGKILIIALFCKVSWSLPKSRPRFRWNRIHWEIPRQLDLKSGCVCIYVERYLPDLINRLIDFSELVFCSWTDDYIIKLASERRTRTNLTGKPNEFSLNWMFLCGHNRLRSQSLDNKAGHPFWHKLKIIIKSNSW